MRNAIANPVGTFSLGEPVGVARSSAGESEGRVFLFLTWRVLMLLFHPQQSRGEIFNYPLFLTHPTDILRDVKMKLSNMQAVVSVGTGTRIQ